ncbi:MAG: hypothetical protein HZB54_05600 [Deltaproteobacteria bacterium]|nr:hypothetical protein [Deltaproteobacteria bacterium]
MNYPAASCGVSENTSQKLQLLLIQKKLRSKLRGIRPEVIKEASLVFMENPMGKPLIPNWNMVTSAIPGILDMLKTAVEEDKK